MPGLAIDSPLALVEVCVGPHMDRPGNVGLLASPRHPRTGWTELSPNEARSLAITLNQAADEAEETAMPMTAQHVIRIEDYDNDRSYWQCDCGNSGSCASYNVDWHAERHVPEGETVVYRTGGDR